MKRRDYHNALIEMGFTNFLSFKEPTDYLGDDVKSIYTFRSGRFHMSVVEPLDGGQPMDTPESLLVVLPDVLSASISVRDMSAPFEEDRGFDMDASSIVTESLLRRAIYKAGLEFIKKQRETNPKDIGDLEAAFAKLSKSAVGC
jgi:hypothetical protein